MEATERQFRALLEAGADGLVVRLSFFVLPEIPRSQEVQRCIARRHSPIASIWNRHLDGVIVTGTEPLTQNLRDEPYWETLTRLFNWAGENTWSSVWSCLAAHAAVLHLDGIERSRLGEKLSGVFASAGVLNDRLTIGCPPRLWMPHSRWNEIPEAPLAACGYRVLSRSKEAGVDAFLKEQKSLFVCFQGHPEYDADSLLLEYRRDIRRFLKNERDHYPAMPSGCFDEHDTAQLNVLHQRALAERSEEIIADFPMAQLTHKARNTWRPAAVRIYRNWLLEISRRKASKAKKAASEQREAAHAAFAGIGFARPAAAMPQMPETAGERSR
jgi:homoserine O-succinyltransferase